MIDFNCLKDLNKKLAPVGEAIKLTKTSLPACTAPIGFAGAPWTLITYIAEGKSSRDFTKARIWAWEMQRNLIILLEILTEATISFLSLQAQEQNA